MIDLATGEVEFFGIKVKPGSRLSDYYSCDPKLIEIYEFRPEDGVIAFREPYVSNNIRAFIKISFGADKGVEDIEINPRFDILPETDSTLWPGLKVELSKKWLHGMAKNGEYQERPEYIGGSYDWGYISSMVLPDRDYGTTGGWIRLRYRR